MSGPCWAPRLVRGDGVAGGGELGRGRAGVQLGACLTGVAQPHTQGLGDGVLCGRVPCVATRLPRHPLAGNPGLGGKSSAGE